MSLKMRHARVDDLEAIYMLATKVGSGMTTLPAHKPTLECRLNRTARTLKGETERHESGYLFVLEKDGKVVGLSAVEVALGLTEPFYNFKTVHQVRASKTLGVYQSYDVLFLSNDYTGKSELCTLFVDPEHRAGNAGKLASKSRFLFIAAHRDKFGDTIIAEMRGVSDNAGHSPLWSALGEHFFGVDFITADRASATLDKSFIAELAPRHPIYVPLLPKSAQDVIGKVHPNTAPALKLLEGEGLKWRGYVDIFDGGPNIEADIDNLRAIKDSRVLACQAGNEDQDAPIYLVSNNRYDDFAVVLARGNFGGMAVLSAQNMALLNVKNGDSVRVLALDPNQG